MNEKGQPDAAPELWTNAVREPLKVALDEGRLHLANKAPITDLGEGWWIPPSTVKKHPELKTVLDVGKERLGVDRPRVCSRFGWFDGKSRGAW